MKVFLNFLVSIFAMGSDEIAPGRDTIVMMSSSGNPYIDSVPNDCSCIPVQAR